MASNGLQVFSCLASVFAVAAIQPHVDSPAALRGANASSVNYLQIQFKHAAEPPPLIDGFVIVYWSVVLVLMFVVIVAAFFVEWNTHGDGDITPRQEADDDVMEIQEDMWSFNLVVALGQAEFKNGMRVPCWAVAILTLVMGGLQLFTIFLIVHDINPAAEPITTVPSTPWVKQTWTVNSMKWIMVIFLVMALVREVHDSEKVLEALYKLDRHRLLVPKAVPGCLTLCHYMVTLAVIWGGVNAICSFNATPDIVYSSLAINFLASIDDMVYQFFDQILRLQSDFKVVSKKGERRHVPMWLEVALKMMLVLPIFWGLFLMGRAWHTNIMPNGRVQDLRRDAQGVHEDASGHFG